MVDISGRSIDDTKATVHRVGADVETRRRLGAIEVDTCSVRSVVVTLGVQVHTLVGHAAGVKLDRKARAK